MFLKSQVLILILGPVLLLGIVSCSEPQDPTQVFSQITSNGNSDNASTDFANLSEAISNFTINSGLCEDEHGPDCTKLRLGDDYHTTSIPSEKGYLYSCEQANPNAPGSIQSKITWIDFVDNVWDFLNKPWLPEGTFSSEPGIYNEILSEKHRQINTNNLPVDGKIGDWPMTDYLQLTEIDPNPGIPNSRRYSFNYTINNQIPWKKIMCPICANVVQRFKSV